jgi:glycosyltransferase involved in cell wall biosynthesis
VALGHDVRLFTVGESTCPVERLHYFPTVPAPMGWAEAEAVHVRAAYAALADTDIIHDHTQLGPLICAGRGGPPVVTTTHSPFDAIRKDNYTQIAEYASIVAISHAQRQSATELPVSAVIHNGVDLDVYQPGPGGGGYLLFIGRMSPDKGVHRAVRVARAAGKKLIIVTRDYNGNEPILNDERRYFEQEVRPLLKPDDPQPRQERLASRIDLLRHADAVLCPIDWPEPFGLVMAEALACGTPVLAFPNGAAPEIVDHGHTGFLCDDEAAMAAAVQRLGSIDRAQCRAVAEQRFGMHRMARNYDALYQRILASDAAYQLTEACV